jgi:hypothetical protein
MAHETHYSVDHSESSREAKVKRHCMRALIVLITLSLFTFGADLGAQDDPQTGRLAMLARVWGLIKHHHPQPSLTAADWDLALYAAIPQARQAAGSGAFSALVIGMINKAGPINPLEFPIFLPQPITTDPFFSWINDTRFFTPTAGYLLKLIVSNLKAPNPFTRYVTSDGTADLSLEPPWDSGDQTSEEFRLLTLFRYWNHVLHFSPHRALTDPAWDTVLSVMIPQFTAAAAPLEFALVCQKLTVMTGDSGAVLSSHVLEDGFWGPYFPPFLTRTLENKIVITRVLNPDLRQIAPGDIIEAVDDEDIAVMRARLLPFLTTANPTVTERELNRILARGQTPTVRLRILRGSEILTVEIDRVSADLYAEWLSPAHQAPAWKTLGDGILLIRPDRLIPEEIDALIFAVKASRAAIFDLRHPLDLIPPGLVEALFDRSVPFARQVLPTQSNPGFFIETAPLTCGPIEENPNPYSGKILVLLSAETGGLAERFCLMLQARPGTLSLGAQTAGSPGIPVQLVLPGGMVTRFSGQGLYYPDGRPIQRSGLIVDIPVSISQEDLLLGRDPVLERALVEAERD